MSKFVQVRFAWFFCPLVIYFYPYRSGNSSSISADLQENLDRLSDDCHQARDVVSKYEKELEDVRDQINDVKPSDPIAWLPNPKTIESESLQLFD